MPSRSSGANMRGVFLFEESRENWVYPQQCTHGIYCVLKGFLGIITHKYPVYRAYIGIFMDFLPIGVRWDRGTSNYPLKEKESSEGKSIISFFKATKFVQFLGVIFGVTSLGSHFVGGSNLMQIYGTV